jgi:hypothetical protein
LYLIDLHVIGTSVRELTNAALGTNPFDIAFDGDKLWTANIGNGPNTGSISIITPSMSNIWPVTNVTTGFSQPFGILFDGSNIWIMDSGLSALLKLDQNGGILQTINGVDTGSPVFDGTNWVPGFSSNTLKVIRASTGTVVATLSGNGFECSNPGGV